MGNLSEENRAKLNGIVNQMVANKETDDAIKFVVEDFKTKYGDKEQVSVQETQTTKPLIQPASGGTMVQNIMQKATLPTKTEYGVENENPIDTEIRLEKQKVLEKDKEIASIDEKATDIESRKKFMEYQTKVQENDLSGLPNDVVENMYQDWKKTTDTRKKSLVSKDTEILDFFTKLKPEIIDEGKEFLQKKGLIETTQQEKETNPLLVAKKQLNDNIQRLESIKTNYTLANEIEKKVGKPIEAMTFDEITKEVNPKEARTGSFNQLADFNETASKSYGLIKGKLEYLQKQNEGIKVNATKLQELINQEQDPIKHNELIGQYDELISTPSVKEEVALTDRANSFEDEMKAKIKENLLLSATNKIVEDSKDKSTLTKLADKPTKSALEFVGGALTLARSGLKAAGMDDNNPVLKYMYGPIGDFGDNMINAAQQIYSPTNNENVKSFYKVTDYKGKKLLIDNGKAYSVRDENNKELEDTDNLISEWNNLPEDKKTKVEDKFNLSSSLYGTLQVVTDMIPMFMGGEVAEAGNVLSKEQKIANYSKGLMTIVAQTHDGIYDQVKDNQVLTEQQKNQLALGVSTAIGLVNLKLGPEERILGLENKEASNALRQVISNNVVNVANGKISPMVIASQFVKQTFKNAGHEVPSEWLDELFVEPLVQNTINGIVNKATGANIENQKIDLESIKEQSLPIILSTGILGGVGSYKGKNQLQQDALWSAVNDIDKFREITANQISSGTLNEELGTKTIQTVEKVANTLQEAPNLSETDKYNVGNLMFHNEQLQNKLESNVAEVLKDKIKARIKDNNNLIGKLIGGDKLTTDEVKNNNLEEEINTNEKEKITTSEEPTIIETTSVVNEVPTNATNVSVELLQKKIKIAEAKGEDTSDLELQLATLNNQDNAIFEQKSSKIVLQDGSTEQKGREEANMELQGVANSDNGLQTPAEARQEEIKVETQPIEVSQVENINLSNENQKDENGIQSGGNEREKNVPESIQSEGEKGGQELNVTTPTELLVEKKSDAVTSASTKDLTLEQQKHNKLATLKNEFNALTVTQRNGKKGSELLKQINPLATELGYTQGMNKSKLQILGKTGKDIKNISIKEEKPLSSQEDIDYALGEINKGRLGWDGDMMSFRPNLGIAWSDIRKGEKDLLEGKTTTLPAKRLVEALAQVRENGGYEIIMGSGALTTTMFVPLNAWDEVELTKEEEDSVLADQAQAEKEVQDWFNSLSLQQQIDFTNGKEVIAEGEVGTDATNTESANNVSSKETSKGKDRIAEGLSDLADILGAKKSIVGDNPKLIDALTKIGLGLIEEGIATTENVFEKIKEYVKNKFGDLNIDDAKDIVESKINEGKPTQTPQDKLTTYNNLRKLAQEFLASGDTKEQVKELIDSGDNPFITDNIDDIINNVEKKERSFARAKEQLAEETIALVNNDTYEPTTNKIQSEKADKFIAENGLKRATELLLTNDLGDMEDSVASIVAQKIIKQNNKEGNYAESARVLDMIMEKFTEAGRLIQTATLWNLMTPEGAILFEKRIIKKAKEKLKEEVDSKLEGINGKLGRIVSEINGSPEIKSYIEKMFGTERKVQKTKATKAIEWLDSIKIKGMTFSTIPGVELLPATYNTAIEIIKVGIKSGVAIAKVLDGAVKSIKDNITENEKFNESAFRKFFIDNLPKIQKDGLAIAEKEIGQQIKDIVKEHYTISDKAKDDLVAKLVEKAGLEQDEAERLKQIIEAQFQKHSVKYLESLAKIDAKNRTKQENKAIEKAKRIDAQITQLEADLKAIEKGTYKSKETPLPKVKSEKEQKLASLRKEKKALVGNKQDYGKVMDAIRQGKATTQDVKNLLYANLGLTEMTDSDMAEIERLHQRITDAPDGSSEQNNRIQDLMEHIENKVGGIDNYGVFKGLMYASVLSGTLTHLKNMTSNTLETISRVFGNALYETIVNKDIGATSFILKNLIEGYKRGALEAQEVIKTGYDSHRNILSLDSNPKIGKKDVLETEAVKNSLLFKGKFNPLKAAKFVKRMMIAEDTLSYYGLKEMEHAIIERRIAREKGLTGKALEDEVNRVMFRNDESVAELKNQAHKEGYVSDKGVRRRVYELAEQNRENKVTKIADENALTFTYNNDPRGFLGRLSTGISNMVRWVDDYNKGLGILTTSVAMFTRVIANVLNQQLNYTPLGAIRSLKKSGYLTDGKSIMSNEERAKIMIKSVTGMLVMTGLYALAKAQSDDDDPLFSITANGYGNSQDNSKLYSLGWQPYTIKIGDKRWNYQASPMGQMLGMIGTVLDNEKYNKDKNVGEKLGILASTGLNQVLSASALQGANQLFDAIGSVNSGNSNKLISIFADKPKMLIPNIVKEAYNLLDNKLYDKSDLKGILLYNVPIAQSYAKPKLNVLGDEITKPRYKFVTQPESVQLLVSLSKKDISPEMPSKATRINGIEMNDEQYYDYVKARGKFLKEQLSNSIESIMEAPKDVAYKIYKEQENFANQRAENEIFNKNREYFIGRMNGTIEEDKGWF